MVQGRAGLRRAGHTQQVIIASHSQAGYGLRDEGLQAQHHRQSTGSCLLLPGPGEPGLCIPPVPPPAPVRRQGKTLC